VTLLILCLIFASILASLVKIPLAVAMAKEGGTMTKSDIDYIIAAFAKATFRAKQSGFDGVEIHAAHTYLINQFLSLYYNRRDDE
jgi:2,4-dienoyl-CoA reductase-like NADH-dependent reductase (Old Yellow Enzyme family)